MQQSTWVGSSCKAMHPYLGYGVFWYHNPFWYSKFLFCTFFFLCIATCVVCKTCDKCGGICSTLCPGEVTATMNSSTRKRQERFLGRDVSKYAPVVQFALRQD